MTKAVSTVSFVIPVVSSNMKAIEQITKIMSKIKGDGAIIKSERERAGSVFEDDDAVSSSSATLEDVKKACKKAKAEHGEKFCNSVLDDHDVPERASLGRRPAAIEDEKSYGSIVDALNKGPVSDDIDDDDLDDLDDDLAEDDDLADDLDDDDDDSIDPDTVKKLLRGISNKNRDKAKKIMAKFKIGKLSEVDKLEKDQVEALYKLASKHS